MRKRSKNTQQLKVLLLAAIILPIVLLLIVSTVGQQDFKMPHKLGLEILGTLQSGLTAVSRSGQGFGHRYLALVGLNEENDKLRAELQKLKNLNEEYREAAATNLRLAKLLELQKSFNPPTQTAQIIGRDPSLWFKTIVINKGTAAGIQKGMPAVTLDGVVGQVTNASPHFAKVLLANDPNSAIDATLQESRVQGIVKGHGDTYQLNYILKNAAVELGDRVITSGLGGVFPKGLSIGRVANVIKNQRGMFKQIEVTPSVDFQQLEYVTIILQESPLAE